MLSEKQGLLLFTFAIALTTNTTASSSNLSYNSQTQRGQISIPHR